MNIKIFKDMGRNKDLFMQLREAEVDKEEIHMVQKMEWEQQVRMDSPLHSMSALKDAETKRNNKSNTSHNGKV